MLPSLAADRGSFESVFSSFMGTESLLDRPVVLIEIIMINLPHI